jgi:Tol biopolymer transport system component
VYSQGAKIDSIWRVDLASGAKYPSGSRLISATRSNRNPQFSPDGKRIVFVSDRSGTNEIWTCDKEGKESTALTSLHAGMTGTPSWSPDGRQIAFETNSSGHFQVMIVDAQGGWPRLLTTNPPDSAAPSWSRDGEWIYFRSMYGGRGQIWRVPSTGGAAVQITRNGGWVAFESWDGKDLYYSGGFGVSPLYRVPVGGGQETKVLDAVQLKSFAPVKDGIYFIAPTEPGGRSYIKFLNTITGKIKPVAAIHKPVSVGLTVSPDGRSLLYSQFDQLDRELILVENFR